MLADQMERQPAILGDLTHRPASDKQVLRDHAPAGGPCAAMRDDKGATGIFQAIDNLLEASSDEPGVRAEQGPDLRCTHPPLKVRDHDLAIAIVQPPCPADEPSAPLPDRTLPEINRIIYTLYPCSRIKCPAHASLPSS